MDLKQISLFVIALLMTFSVSAQELNCEVEVNAQVVANADPKIFKSLEQAINEFMNNRTWSETEYEGFEKIKCSIFLNITKDKGNNQYDASLSVQASRPVYNTTYETTLINLIDEQVTFKYQEFQPLEYTENIYISNLTSILGFYAHIIIGIDQYSFSKNGGLEQFEKAEAVINSAQASGNVGWRPFDGLRNRYWLVTNMLENRYDPYRDAWFEYHRNGLDQFYEDPVAGQQEVLKALNKFRQLAVENKGAYLIQLLSQAKMDEIVNIFELADKDKKQQVYASLIAIDPASRDKFDRLK